MQVKCVKCKSVEELSDEEIEFLVNIARKYNDNVSPNDYTAILSIIKGECSHGKKHMYVFDEAFNKKVAELISEFDKLSTNNAAKEKELSETLQKIEDLKNEISNLGKKRDDFIIDIENMNKDMDKVKLTFEKETGGCDMKMWS